MKKEQMTISRSGVVSAGRWPARAGERAPQQPQQAARVEMPLASSRDWARYVESRLRQFAMR